MSKKPYKFIEISPSILGVEFKDEAQMALMFMRLQEYTEGLKKFRGNILPEGDMLIHYFKKRKKIYYKAGWAGFNVKGATILEAATKGGIWNGYELDLFNKIGNTFGQRFDDYKRGRWYVIAWIKGDKPTKRHELCHATFYLNREYLTKVYGVLNDTNIKKAQKYLKKLGYYVNRRNFTGEYILYDEINAYAMTDPKKDVAKLHLDNKTLRKLRKLYKTYVK